MFDGRRIPLTQWFAAIFYLNQPSLDTSVKEIAQRLNVPYKTAWVLKTKVKSRRKSDCDEALIKKLQPSAAIIAKEYGRIACRERP